MNQQQSPRHGKSSSSPPLCDAPAKISPFRSAMRTEPNATFETEAWMCGTGFKKPDFFACCGQAEHTTLGPATGSRSCPMFERTLLPSFISCEKIPPCAIRDGVREVVNGKTLKAQHNEKLQKSNPTTVGIKAQEIVLDYDHGRTMIHFAARRRQKCLRYLN